MIKTKQKQKNQSKTTLDKLKVAILAKYLDKIATYQEFRYSKLDPSSSAPSFGKHCTHYPVKK